MSRQVTHIDVRIQQVDGGRWKITMPKAPGWAVVAHSPQTFTAGIRSGFTEAQIAAHSTWLGHEYDEPSAFEHRRHKPKSRGGRRKDIYAADEWRKLNNGMWQSPGAGHQYPEWSETVQRVMAQRRAMGLSASPDPRAPDYIPPKRRKVRRDDWSTALKTLGGSGPTRLVRPTSESLEDRSSA